MHSDNSLEINYKIQHLRSSKMVHYTPLNYNPQAFYLIKAMNFKLGEHRQQLYVF